MAETTELPVFDGVKPVGKCGVCGRELYPDSGPSICSFREYCSMRGERWQEYQLARQMRNAWVGGKL